MKWFEELKVLFSKDEEPKKPELRKLEVPYDYIPEVLSLADVITTKEYRHEGCWSEVLQMWDIIGEALPETRTGAWALSLDRGRLFVKEKD